MPRQVPYDVNPIAVGWFDGAVRGKWDDENFFEKSLDRGALKNYISAQVCMSRLQEPTEDPQFQACLRGGVKDERKRCCG